MRNLSLNVAGYSTKNTPIKSMSSKLFDFMVDFGYKGTRMFFQGTIYLISSIMGR